MGEPFLSGFFPAELEAVLRTVGLDLVEDLSGDDMGARYCADRADGLSFGPFSHIALARI